MGKLNAYALFIIHIQLLNIYILQSTHYCHQPKTPIGASRALKIVKNGVELRKLWPPKVEEVKIQKENYQMLQRPIPQTPKNLPCMLFYCY
jgi:hypothetical protein